MTRKNAISWFEIPTQDLDRAQNFYEAVLGVQLAPLDLGDFRMRMFPAADETCVGGALVHTKENYYKTSSTDGPLVYLNANPDLQQALDRVAQNGGKILIPKTQISPEYGYMATIIDSEGNRIALHSTS